MDFKLSHSLSTKQLFKQTSLFVLFPFFLNSNQNWWDNPPSDPLFSNVCLFSQFFVSVVFKFLSPLLFCISFVQNFVYLSYRPSIVPLRFIHSFGSCLSGWENKRWKDVGIVTSVIIIIVIINIVIIIIVKTLCNRIWRLSSPIDYLHQSSTCSCPSKRPRPNSQISRNQNRNFDWLRLLFVSTLSE